MNQYSFYIILNKETTNEEQQAPQCRLLDLYTNEMALYILYDFNSFAQNESVSIFLQNFKNKETTNEEKQVTQCRCVYLNSRT